MKQLVKSLGKKPVKSAKAVVKSVIAKIPPPKSRLTGTLAINNGTPVRNRRFRPWPEFPSGSWSEWTFSLGPVLKNIFCSGVEGLPQPLGKQFMAAWSKYCEVKHTLLLPHGTDALRIALAATMEQEGFEYGGEIIVPNISFVASANAALDRRLGVALVDVDAGTLNIDPARVEEAIIPGKTKAIMAVHLFGQPADMSRLRAIAQKHSLKIIEDAAQAHGAIHELGKVGGLGDAGGFSFQGFKNLPSGEGGALTTNDAAIFERAYEIHNVGRKRVGGLRWGHESLGWNCRPTEYVAAVLLQRFKVLESQQKRRWESSQLLRHLMGGLQSVTPLQIGPGVMRHGVHMFGMRYHRERCGGLEVNDFLKAVQAEGIPLIRGYEKTMAQQPVMQRMLQQWPEYMRFLETPVADKVVHELIYLPHQVFLGNDDEISEVAAAFRKVETFYAGRAAGISIQSPVVIPEPKSSEARASVKETTQDKSRLRVGIVGSGFMGLQHAATLSKLSNYQLAGISDVNLASAKKGAEQYECTAFPSAEQLLKDGRLDVVVIATPHWQHEELSTLAFKSGVHVICEKPLTVTVEQANRLMKIAQASGKQFAVVHQTRFEPSYQFAKKLLDSGELGAPYRCSIVESAWRTDAYYRSSSWRGTWKGEGGGVLLNQAPHVLDRYIWLCGMPSAVYGRCDTTRHPIEVEDCVSATLHHKNGLQGFLHVNTVECPPVSQIVICCDQGKIEVSSGSVRVTRLKTSITDATRNDQRLWGDLPHETSTFDFQYGDTMGSLLLEFYSNFAAALENRASLICPGSAGRDAVELANAIVLSSEERRELDLPIDASAYSRLVEQKIKLSEQRTPARVA